MGNRMSSAQEKALRELVEADHGMAEPPVNGRTLTCLERDGWVERNRHGIWFVTQNAKDWYRAEQVAKLPCACGKLPAQSFHKRFCPVREAEAAGEDLSPLVSRTLADGTVITVGSRVVGMLDGELVGTVESLASARLADSSHWDDMVTVVSDVDGLSYGFLPEELRGMDASVASEAIGHLVAHCGYTRKAAARLVAAQGAAVPTAGDVAKMTGDPVGWLATLTAEVKALPPVEVAVAQIRARLPRRASRRKPSKRRVR